jgi:hypothetical protein
MDKVYEAKNNFCLAIPYGNSERKKWSKKSEVLKKNFLRKNPKTQSFILEKVKLGVGGYFLGALLI